MWIHWLILAGAVVMGILVSIKYKKFDLKMIIRTYLPVFIILLIATAAVFLGLFE